MKSAETPQGHKQKSCSYINQPYISRTPSVPNSHPISANPTWTCAPANAVHISFIWKQSTLKHGCMSGVWRVEAALRNPLKRPVGSPTVTPLFRAVVLSISVNDYGRRAATSLSAFTASRARLLGLKPVCGEQTDTCSQWSHH